MRHATSQLVVLVGLTLVTLGGCRHRPTITRPMPSTMVEEHCWWAAFRSPLPHDSVVARYARAFASVGLTGVRTSRLADTAWAQAGPTPLDRADRRDTYAARIVAYQRGDSALFRTFVSVVPDAASDSSPRVGALHIALCQAIGQAAQAQGAAPREPGDEETQAVWRARP